MPVLAAAIIVVGVLCLLDLLMTFGVIRRLREHAELITQLSQPDVPVIGLAAGESPTAFTAKTTMGRPLAGSAGLRVAGFFSTTCSVCPGRVPLFVHYLITNQVPVDSVLAVVVSPDGDEQPSYYNSLAEVAQIARARHGDAVTQAFKVIGYPSFCLLDVDGSVLATSHDPARLPVPAAVG